MDADEAGVRSRLSELRLKWGVDFPLIREIALTILDGKWHTNNEIAEELAVSHRMVRTVYDALSDFVETDGERYRARHPLQLTGPANRKETTDRQALVDRMQRYLDDSPPPLSDLDHVPATADTCIDRALWIAGQYDLTGAHVIFIGDHDLTSVALRLVDSDVSITVVDVDERLLRYIAEHSYRSNLNIRALFADLRVELPRSTECSADIALADPPYSPDGVGLFAARAIQSLRQDRPTRFLLCYGYSYFRPDQGYRVQSVLHELRLLFEGIIPRFNRYKGAFAIGSTSNLYIFRPTRRSRASADSYNTETNIYTKGTNSVESSIEEPDILSIMERNNVAIPGNEKTTLVGYGFPDKRAYAWTSLHGYFATIFRSRYSPGRDKIPFGNTTVVSLLPDHQEYLVRVILASRTPRLILVGTAGTADRLFSSEPAIRELVSCFYTIEEANAIDSQLELLDFSYIQKPRDDFQQVIRGIADRKDGKVLNAWRKELDIICRRRKMKVTKNDIRQIIDQSPLSRVHQSSYFNELSVYDLGRLVQDVRTSLQVLSDTHEPAS